MTSRQTLAEAEKLLNQHQQLKEEVEGYANEYAQMKEYGENVVEGQDDVQYMFLREVSHTRPASAALFKLMSQLICLSATQATNQSINQSISQSINVCAAPAVEAEGSRRRLERSTEDGAEQTTDAVAKPQPTGLLPPT